MNVKILLKAWKIISVASVILVPIIWISLNQFNLLLVNFLWHTLYTWMYIIAWYSVIFVMWIRPLADLFPKVKVFRQLCMLRRAFWILSAMIICTLLVYNWVSYPSSFFWFFTLDWWSYGYPLLARLSEITAIILLLTSNNFSQKKLKKNWKRVQRLSYVYLIAGWIVAYRYWDDYFIKATLILVIVLFILAEIKKSKILEKFIKTPKQ